MGSTLILGWKICVLHLESGQSLQKSTWLSYFIGDDSFKKKREGQNSYATDVTRTVRVKCSNFFLFRKFDLKEALNTIGVQICSEVNRSLSERGFPTLNMEIQNSLVGQICSIVEEENPISSLIG